MVALRLSNIIVTAVATTCLWPALAAGLPLPLGDAGTGMDAGGTPETALALEFGAYEANLTPTDADWYRFPVASVPTCLDVDAGASAPMRFSVRAGDASAEGLAEDAVFAATLAAAPGSIELGVLPDEAPWAAASVGPYSFSVQAHPPEALGDTRADDAPATVASAAPAPGDCFGATFLHDGPDVDVWTFHADAGELVTYSLAVGPQAVGELRILAPAGDVVVGPIGSGDAGTFVAPATGTYSLRAQSLTSVENAQYVIGLVVGPDPTGCRPYCVEGALPATG